MRLHSGAWLPDDESDRVILNSGLDYQRDKYEAATRYVRQWRRAVDIGAHCGLWASRMVKQFSRVECFEPLPKHVECFVRNVQGKNHALYEIALGAKDGRCGMNVIEGFSGRSHVVDGDAVNVTPLDRFGFEDVDFLKVDVEGYELFVLRGAEETLKKCRPVMVVEQKPGHAQKYGLQDTEALSFLESLGAKVRMEIFGDYILSWDVE